MKIVVFCSLGLMTLSCSNGKPTVQQEIILGSQVQGPDTTFTFDSAVAGSFPRSWTIVTSRWQIVDDAGNKALKQEGESRSDLFNMCVESEHKYLNTEMSVRIKALSGLSDQGGGLIWRFRNSGNYYLVRANPLERDLRLFRVVDGHRELLEYAKIGMKAGSWYSVAVAVKRNLIECYFNGQKLMTVEDNAYTGEGLIGLWSKADAISLFDDLSVKELE